VGSRVLAVAGALLGGLGFFVCAVVGVYYDPKDHEDRVLQAEILVCAGALAVLLWPLVRFAVLGRRPSPRGWIVAGLAAATLTVAAALFFLGPVQP
jgi:hypothetical protein